MSGFGWKKLRAWRDGCRQNQKRSTGAWLEALEPRVHLSAVDPILYWNQVAIDTALADTRAETSSQPGPIYTSRAMAIVHIAMFDAYNGVEREFEHMMCKRKAPKANMEAAVATAAYRTLLELYPDQQASLDAAYGDMMDDVAEGPARRRGITHGRLIARNVMNHRSHDGSNADMSYTPRDEPGYHQKDPLNPDQPYLGPGWGNVKTFVKGSKQAYVPPAFPDMDSEEYAEMWQEVYVKGAADAEVADRDNDMQPDRSDEETEIGIFWAYDARLGTPVRIYNLAARVIADDMENTVGENARLFALINIAMADAGINAWATKYEHEIWRPIVAIRNADLDGNDDTTQDAAWAPLGAPGNAGDPAGYGGGVGPEADPDPDNSAFTPPFPAYTSGHSTFGAAAFKTIALFYNNDNIAFSLTSEDSGTTRNFNSLSEASAENGQSRIYLGVHWQADNQHGMAAGEAIAELVVGSILLPKA